MASGCTCFFGLARDNVLGTFALNPVESRAGETAGIVQCGTDVKNLRGRAIRSRRCCAVFRASSAYFSSRSIACKRGPTSVALIAALTSSRSRRRCSRREATSRRAASDDARAPANSTAWLLSSTNAWSRNKVEPFLATASKRQYVPH